MGNKIDEDNEACVKKPGYYNSRINSGPLSYVRSVLDYPEIKIRTYDIDLPINTKDLIPIINKNNISQN